MSRLRTPKVSHLVGCQRAVARSAAWSLFRPGETRLPYGYRAELASVLIGAEMGLPCDIPNHASYIKMWTEVLKRDKREIFRAASDAQKIADYLLGFHPDYALVTANAGDSFEDAAAASTQSDTTQAA